MSKPKSLRAQIQDVNNLLDALGAPDAPTPVRRMQSMITASFGDAAIQDLVDQAHQGSEAMDRLRKMADAWESRHADEVRTTAPWAIVRWVRGVQK